ALAPSAYSVTIAATPVTDLELEIPPKYGDKECRPIVPQLAETVTLKATPDPAVLKSSALPLRSVIAVVYWDELKPQALIILVTEVVTSELTAPTGTPA